MKLLKTCHKSLQNYSSPFALSVNICQNITPLKFSMYIIWETFRGRNVMWTGLVFSMSSLGLTGLAIIHQYFAVRMLFKFCTSQSIGYLGYW